MWPANMEFATPARPHDPYAAVPAPAPDNTEDVTSSGAASAAGAGGGTGADSGSGSADTPTEDSTQRNSAGDTDASGGDASDAAGMLASMMSDGGVDGLDQMFAEVRVAVCVWRVCLWLRVCLWQCVATWLRGCVAVLTRDWNQIQRIREMSLSGSVDDASRREAASAAAMQLLTVMGLDGDDADFFAEDGDGDA